MKRLYPRLLIALTIILAGAISVYAGMSTPVALAPAKTPTAALVVQPTAIATQQILPTPVAIAKVEPGPAPVSVTQKPVKRTDNIDDDIPDAVVDRWYALATAYGDVGIRKIVAVRGKKYTVTGLSTVVYVNLDSTNLVDEFTWHYAKRAYFWLRAREPKRMAVYERGGWREFARLLVGTRWND